ncbi:8-amino-7-oxononanoate synthase [Fischerella thermalis]|uniref:8-amino-7-ketopelargonate synthase n=6 Tax=Fischerella TaxID=1190 RepID=G6FWD0_9CYAN|nr:8-amino-7-oxononanoate synthase [Fischerella thermalis]EHC11537.1 8-amino-7-oxononanoate synthase [Fischerella thermalis JSC-11]PLZ15189.1 8-amino-7-oxononanoate synthase [Fischerella thermalis WC114]PLZ16274.1 8-amino-7-oxononanoate synthase [Fischerella thermalis WC1110]PLZ22969.1 8-amino-7-oxononanoate synthase [Fischerella thermalis WC157]PLZ45767.1 8-amino-7-oxononanoate synthase [Fischerella thermalis WC538]
MSDPYAWIEQSLATIHRADWYRSVQTIEGCPGATVLLQGQEVINFASNDYLGLAGDERLILAATAAVQEFGTGSTGSRLLSGHRKIHRELEKAIASLKQTEDAVVFSSGYLANLGAITALVSKRDLILADQYNHSSLKNGAILSGAKIVEYPHCDVEAVKSELQRLRPDYRRCLIATDSVFSMDGDLCPLPALIDLAQEFSCMLLVDEAHATGVLGKTGAGCVEHFGCTGKQLVQIGTLSKALGSLGGYVAGSATLIDYLRNRAPSWIYTTALSPADTAAALAAINIIQQEPQRRTQLWKNVDYLKNLIHQYLPNLKLLPSQSPILCLEFANATDALQAGNQLKSAGIFAPAIRPPTVPTSRIRISLMATHEQTHINKLIEQLSLIFH